MGLCFLNQSGFPRAVSLAALSSAGPGAHALQQGVRKGLPRVFSDLTSPCHYSLAPLKCKGPSSPSGRGGACLGARAILLPTWEPSRGWGGLCRGESWALRTKRKNRPHEAVPSREITQCQSVGAQTPSRRRGQGRDEEMRRCQFSPVRLNLEGLDLQPWTNSTTSPCLAQRRLEGTQLAPWWGEGCHKSAVCYPALLGCPVASPRTQPVPHTGVTPRALSLIHI